MKLCLFPLHLSEPMRDVQRARRGEFPPVTNSLEAKSSLGKGALFCAFCIPKEKKENAGTNR